MARIGLSATALAGAAGAVYGVWKIYDPAGWIAGGLVLMGISVLLWSEIR